MNVLKAPKADAALGVQYMPSFSGKDVINIPVVFLIM
jgi:hypothetical protein